MQGVQFETGGQRYAIDVQDIVEVLPAVALRFVPGAAEGIAGVLRFHGQLVPVMDLTKILTGKAAPRLKSTRLILVRAKRGDDAQDLLGILAENATLGITDELDSSRDLSPLGIGSGTAPFLSSMTTHGEPSIVLLTTEKLISEEIGRAHV